MIARWPLWITQGLLLVSLSITGSCALGRHKAWPDKTWDRVPDLASAGWDVDKLRDLRLFAEHEGTASLLVVQDGRIVLSYGDIKRPLKAHSIRKSLVSALYGTYLGRLNLNTTLEQVGIDDYGRLTPQEKSATARDLLMARSGVFLPGAYENHAFDRFRPKRGTYPPGARWSYQNWDFNVAGFILELMTGDNLFRSFRDRIAAPIGMQDYDIQDMRWRYDPRTWHPAYLFRISTRDLARFGLLFLRGGRWKDHQIIPATWVYESTRWHSQVRKPDGTLLPGSGYGYMWWVGDSTLPPKLSDQLYAAVGTGEQFLGVLPRLGIVFVHRTDTDLPPEEFNTVDHSDIMTMLKMVAEAYDPERE